MNVSQIGSILLTLLSLIGLAACAATITPTLPPPPTRQPTPTPDPAKGRPNRLINEKSPYLLQHAYNPVNWYPWGPEAFDAAKRENKPIFLSIGYATCHWCHVMEKESFEDPEVARLMNDTFISIKVDREERPDLDNLYMNVAVGMNGSGGWPLTIFMTSGRQPFLAATYIPKENRFGRVGLLTLIPQIKTAWATQPADLVNVGSQVITALQQAGGAAPGQELDRAVLDQAYQQLNQLFDSANGGFGDAPKFPAPHNLLFLLRYGQRSGDARALKMVETTLQKMRQGGIYDHIGFGFHRYATDARWRTPHFEKMLYDQAMLVLTYAETYQVTGKEEYAQTAREILTYVLRDMTAPAGGFYSAEDADSEGEEGKFYLWTEAEIRQVLPPNEAEPVITAFNVTTTGNFTGAETFGANILYIDKSSADLSTRLESARSKLFETRQTRPRPLLDDKILTDWNGLMIAALAKSAQALHEPAYAQAAAHSADFILKTMRRADGRLLHRYRDGEAALQANLDDYAFLTWGLLELYETIFDIKYLNQAIFLTDEMIVHFEDDAAGGFYFTPNDGELLPMRRQEIGDGALPAGNSVAMLNLLRLGRMTANPAYEEKAVRLSQAFAGNVRQTPSGYTHLLAAIDFALGPSAEVVISGDPAAADTQAMLNALWREFAPHKVVLLRPPGDSPDIVRLAEFTQYQLMRNNQATVYVCFNYHCKAPTNDVDQMIALLRAV